MLRCHACLVSFYTDILWLFIPQVEFTKADVDLFHQKLDLTRFPKAFLRDVNMTYGYPSSALPYLARDLKAFDWRKWADNVSFANSLSLLCSLVYRQMSRSCRNY